MRILDFSEKQDQIGQHKLATIAAYPQQWSRMVAAWQENTDEDLAFLTYSANYLFRTGGVRWAIDPLTLHRRVPDAQQVNVAKDLSELEFVILTHEHGDHIDDALIHKLRNTAIRWVVPKPLLSKVMKLGLLEKNIIIPENLKPISMNSVNIVPFEGLHWEKIQRDEMADFHGVPSTSYMVEFHGKRWLFPGDIRDFNIDAIPDFGVVDGVFAHLWLGRRCALVDPPPLVDAFCTFFTSLKSKRIVITHLEELCRNALDYWDESHCHLVQSRIQHMAPSIKVLAAFMGDKVIL